MNPADPKGESPRYTILVGMAFDETDATALNEAARVAALQPNSELHVVHSVPEAAANTATEQLLSLDQSLQEAPREMERRVEALQASAPLRVVGHVRAGVPARAILQTAADLDADLIVVASHQRRGAKKLLLGSVATEVVQYARCPVLIAIPKDHSFESRSERVEPPCPKCLGIRAQSAGQAMWCEQHARSYLKPHVYEPSDRRRTSVMPTF